MRLRFRDFLTGFFCCLLIMVYQITFTATPWVRYLVTPNVYVTKQLSEIADQLDEAVMRNRPPSQQAMTNIHQLFELLSPQYKKVSTSITSPDVCMETYKETEYEWVTDKCSYEKPMSRLIEVVLYNPSCEKNLATVLGGISKAYPALKVHIGLGSSCIHVGTQLKVKNIISSDNMKPGVVWNRLMSYVSTPYLLVGRNLDNFDAEFSSLIRQIRVLGTTPNVQVVGGAFRNQSGHWRVGCFQSDIRNYALTYQDGYFVSRNECMYCDHLLGPFVTRTSVMKKIPLSDSLPAAVLFEDWFLQLRNKRMYAMNCPDVMYLATDPKAEEKAKKSYLWTPLARKWEINRLTWPPGSIHVFTCTDAGITCDNIFSVIRSRLIPLCCLEEISSKLRVLDTFFANYSIDYEVFSGSVLGAVKMADFIPWDIDFDIIYPSNKRDTVVNAKDVLAAHGLTIGSIDERDRRGFCRLFTRNSTNIFSNFYFEMFANLRGSVSQYRCTKIDVHGVWVNGPTNPGMYARNRYGRGILKHAQHPRHTHVGGDIDSPYVAGNFLACESDHHACLDRYPADGSLHYKVN